MFSFLLSVHYIGTLKRPLSGHLWIMLQPKEWMFARYYSREMKEDNSNRGSSGSCVFVDVIVCFGLNILFAWIIWTVASVIGQFCQDVINLWNTMKLHCWAESFCVCHFCCRSDRGDAAFPKDSLCFRKCTNAFVCFPTFVLCSKVSSGACFFSHRHWSVCLYHRHGLLLRQIYKSRKYLAD